MPSKKRPEGSRRPNGASSIYQGNDGKWHGYVTVGVHDTGKMDRRHIERKTEREVVRAVRELERQRSNGKVRKPGSAWTVEQWLRHWVENIAAPSVRETTMVGYRSSVYNHLIPGVGAHKLDKLQPEHLESLYARLQEPERSGGKELKPATVHLAHRTASVAFNEAVRRRRLLENPTRIAKPPRVEQNEISPFSRDEARKLVDTAAELRNGARYIIALSVGLRRGEALGLKWSDIDVKWRHGCDKGSSCRRRQAHECPERQGRGTLTIRRTLQTRTWRHGCDPEGSCGYRLGAYCPKRFGGGIVEAEVKSNAGRRVIGLPHQVIKALNNQRVQQDVDRDNAANLWEPGDWVFTTHVGRPIHPTEDHRGWKALLSRAGVRDARLHDARHTAATVLLELKVPLPAVMELMGWSSAAMAKRYMHTNEELATAIAAEVGGHIWAEYEDDDQDDGHDGAAGAVVPG